MNALENINKVELIQKTDSCKKGKHAKSQPDPTPIHTCVCHQNRYLPQDVFGAFVVSGYNNARSRPI